MKRMPPKHDLAGQKFGRLTAKEWVRTADMDAGKWLCVCDCGNEHMVNTKLLRNAEVKSCGCASYEMMGSGRRTHGRSKTRIYGVWTAMRARCEDSADKSYKNYGGRGIKVCERWTTSFELFLADMGMPPDGMTLERIDNDGGYEPGNCRWASRKEQSRNQRKSRLVEHEGETRCLSDWAERLGFRDSFLRRRMDVQGMTFSEAISRPKRYAVLRARDQAGPDLT